MNQDATLEKAFESALAAVRRTPDSADAWEHLEEFAEHPGFDERVAQAYADGVRSASDAQVLSFVAQRATRFLDEWFGDDPGRIIAVLDTVLDRDPTAKWAFDRLTELLQSQARWDELFARYDRVLEAPLTAERRVALLEEAADIARNMVDRPDKALDYLLALQQLDPRNEARRRTIVRMLERAGRWRDLIALDQQQAEHLEGEERCALLLEVARLMRARIGDTAGAVEQLRQVLTVIRGHEGACALLEEVVADDQVDPAVRLDAMELAVQHHQDAHRLEDAVRLLLAGAAFAPDATRQGLYRRAAALYAIMGDDAQAIATYRNVLSVDPTDADAVRQIRHLAARSKRFDLQVAALVDAAEATDDATLRAEYLQEAARLYAQMLGAPDEAVRILRGLLDDAADDAAALAAARELDALLIDAGTERLPVLHRIAELEGSALARRAARVEAARLALDASLLDEALADWNALLSEYPDDREALDAVIDILERQQKWDMLAVYLQRRADAAMSPQQRAGDLARVARIQSEHLDDGAAAVETWQAYIEEFGPTEEVLTHLEPLLRAQERYRELFDVLAQAEEQLAGSSVERCVRLGAVAADHLDDAQAATTYLSRALVLDPRNAEAADRLAALAQNDACRSRAVAVLEWAFRITENWAALVSLAPLRLAESSADAVAARVHKETAAIALHQLEDAPTAMRHLCAALRSDPFDGQVLEDLVTCPQDPEAWREVAACIQEAADSIPPEHAQRGVLLDRAAAIFEQHLGDPAAALSVRRRAVRVTDPAAELRITLGLSLASGAWSDAAEIAVDCARLQGRVDAALVQTVEDRVADAKDFAAFCEELERALDGAEGLEPGLYSALALQVASWFKDRCGDVQRAKQVAAKAVDAQPGDLAARRMLVSLQRAAEDPAYIDGAVALFAAAPSEFAVLHEAAAAAAGFGADYEQQRGLWMRVFEESSRRWLAGADASAMNIAFDALLKVAQIDLENARKARAAEVLAQGAALPFDAARCTTLRKKAVGWLIEAEELDRAITVCNQALGDNPNSTEFLDILDDLLGRRGRHLELLSVRRRRLDAATDEERKAAIRLDLVRLRDAMEGADSDVDLLRRNLDAFPGHRPSVEALIALYTKRAMFGPLCAFLEEQAQAAEERGEAEFAVSLWDKAARVAMEELHDEEAAVRAYTRLCTLTGKPVYLDALSRLHQKRGEYEQAAKWLARRLDGADDEQRVPIAVRLARVLLAWGRSEQAVSLLETAFEEAPKNAEVRKLLFEQYRQLEHTEKLAAALVRALEYVPDRRSAAAYASEAARLYFDELGQPESALAALEKLYAIEPDTPGLKKMLAASRQAAGRLEEAKALLEQMLADFGRRRNPQRAAVHVQLAEVLVGMDARDEAMAHLEQALSMDSRNVRIAEKLARLAVDMENFDLAERTWRSVLMTLRRDPEVDADLTPAHVLVELAVIAKKRGDADKLAQLRDSIIEELSVSDALIGDLHQRLWEHEEFDVLRRVYEARLEYADKPSLRGRYLTRLADLFAGPLADQEKALEVRLQAVSAAPGSPTAHEPTVALAAALGKMDAYEALLDELLTTHRRDQDAMVRCELLLRKADLALGVHDRVQDAQAAYEEAAALGVREVDVLRLAARIAHAQGDTEREVAVLTQLAQLGAREAEQDARIEALFSLSEINLADPDTFEEGVAQLDEAFSASGNAERTARILLRAVDRAQDASALLAVLKKVAAKTEDAAIHLTYYTLGARTGALGPARLRVGARMAAERGDTQAETQILDAMVAQAATEAEDIAAQVWALSRIAQLRQEAADWAGAVKAFEQAAELSADDDVFALGIAVGEAVSAHTDDLLLAQRVYERLWHQRPGDPRAFGPLSDIYARLNDLEALEILVEDTLYAIEDVASRNELRLRWAELLLQTDDRKDEAVDVLKNVLLDDPAEMRALSMMAAYYDAVGQSDEYAAVLRDRFEEALDQGRLEEAAALSLEIGRRDSDAEACAQRYRRVLEAGADDVAVMRALIGLLDPEQSALERAALLERMVPHLSDEEVADAAVEAARAYREAGDAQRAVSVLQAAFAEHPDDPVLRSALEEDCRQRGDYPGLVALLKRSAEIAQDGENRVAMLREIAQLCREHTNDVDTELWALDQWAQAGGDAVEVAVAAVDALGRAARYQEAFEKARQLVEAEDLDPQVRLQVLVACAKMSAALGDVPGQVQYLEQAAAIDRSAVADDFESALRALRTQAAAAQDLEGERRTVVRLCGLYEETDRASDAIALLSQYCDQHPDDVEGWRRLAQLTKDAGDWAALVEVCKKLTVLTEDEEQVAAAEMLLDACSHTEQWEVARRGLEYVYGGNPHGARLHDALKDVYTRLEMWRELGAMYVRDAQDAQDDEARAAAFRSAADVYLRGDDTDMAMRALQEALAIDPDDEQSNLLLIELTIRAGEVDRAEEMVRAAIANSTKKRGPELARLQGYQAQICGLRGDRAEQLQWLVQAASSDRTNGDIAADLADLAWELEEWDVAQKALRNISLLKEPCRISKAEAFLRQGYIAHREGDDRKASIYAKKAASEDPALQGEVDAFLATLSV